MITNWRVHLYFILISLVPFVLADVSFPYIIGSDQHWKVFFSTCFWPTLTCVFFVPSMIAGIRCSNGDDDWSDITGHWGYVKAEGVRFWKSLLCLVACFAAAVLPVNYIALDFAVVLPNLEPSTAAIVRPLISTVIKIGCFKVFRRVITKDKISKGPRGNEKEQKERRTLTNKRHPLSEDMQHSS